MFSSALRRLVQPYRSSIRNKLIVVMVLLPVVPITIVTAFAAEHNRSSMEAEVVRTNVSNMRWTATNLGERFAQLNNLIYSIQIHPEVNDYMNGATSLSREFAAQRVIMNMLTSVLYSGNNQLVGVDLYLKDNEKRFVVDSSRNDVETVTDVPDAFKQLFEENKDFLVQANAADPEKFRLVRSINRFENREKRGGIALDVRWSIFHQSMDLLAPKPEEEVLIVDAEGAVMYRRGDPEAGDATAFREVVEGRTESGYARTEDGYVFFGPIDPSGLIVVKTVPGGVITESAVQTMRTGLAVGIVSVILSAAVAVVLGWRMSSPIVALARKLGGVGLLGETDRPARWRHDEIGLLESRLHGMSSRIREHIKTEYSMKLDMKTAELRALQAQINPHFLQNTLQLIGTMLFTKKPEECYDVIKSLSEMFRYVVRNPGQLVTIRQELDHLAHYMRIQEMRFAGRLAYRLRAEPEALHARLPKLSLQPIVENAFMHGLDSKPGAWELDVTIRAEAAAVVVEIEDNGIGIEPEKLTVIRRRLEDARSGDGAEERIGIRNVVARIREHFGPEYGISVDSERNGGTTVKIRAPSPEMGEAADD